MQAGFDLAKAFEALGDPTLRKPLRYLQGLGAKEKIYFIMYYV